MNAVTAMFPLHGILDDEPPGPAAGTEHDDPHRHPPHLVRTRERRGCGENQQLGSRTALRGGDHVRAQGDLQHVADVVGDVEGHLLANLLGDVLQVALVPLRNDDLLQAGPVSREDLLLDPTDRQDLALAT